LERDEKADKASSIFWTWKSRGLPEDFLMPTKPTYEELEQRIRELERLHSEHKQAETKLRLAQFSVDQSSEGILWISEDARIHYANKAACRHLGYSGDELTGMSVFDIDPDFTAEVWPGHWRKLKQKGRLLIESRHIRKSGEIVPVEISISFLEFEGEQYNFAFIRDITYRKQAEEALKESENKFKAAFEGSHDAITLTTREGRLLDCNRRALELFGLESKQDFKDRRPADFSPQVQPDGRGSYEASRELINKVLEYGGFVQFEWLHRRKTGETFPAEVLLTPIRIGDQEVLLASIRDISKRKRADEQMAHLQDQLRQAQKVEAIGQLAGGIAHDFNNALTVILGNAEMALRDLGKEHPLYGMIREIKKAGERASNLTRQLLAFSRRQILQPEVLDLNDVVLRMEKMLRRIIGENIGLETHLTPELGSVEADPGQVEQVIVNLAVNARDAMPEGGTLTIETKTVELDEDYARTRLGVRPGNYVMLSVGDTGIGMTKEIQARIFEPFFTTKGKELGTGLGLSTVYGIVKQSKGNIWAYSEPGMGTVFRIYLPLVEKAVSKHKDTSGEIQIPHGSETVLLVEDEEMVREIVLKFLKKYGYTVLSSADGREALKICREHKGRIHLLLTDVVMPGMSGKELARQAMELLPDLKVLFMSGYTDNAIDQQGVLEKGVAFIEKPFTHQGLAWKLRWVLEE